MKKFAALVILLCVSGAAAQNCGADWTSLGAPPYQILCAARGGEGEVLAGTMWSVTSPGSGGIYRAGATPGEWTYVALRDRRVRRIEQTVEPSDTLYAVTSGGLFRSCDRGDTWVLFFRNPDSGWEMQGFSICPDHPEQMVGSWHDGNETGFLYASSDGGAHWGYVAIGVQGHAGLVYSATQAGILYFCEGSWFGSVDMADSSTQYIREFVGQNIWRIIRHPLNQRIYVLTQDSIAIYDEGHGTFAGHSIPAVLGFARDMVVDAEGKILIGGRYGIASGDTTLEDWTDETVGIGEDTTPLFADENGWLADHYPVGPYCRGTAAAEEQPVPLNSRISITAYPNPTNASATLMLDLPQWVRAERVRLFNVLGREAARMEFAGCAQAKVISLPIEGLPSGVYVVKVDAGAHFVPAVKLAVIR